MRDPSAAFEDGDLRKPVRDEVVVADGAGAAERPRDACLPARRATRSRSPGCHRRRQRSPPPACDRSGLPSSGCTNVKVGHQVEAGVPSALASASAVTSIYDQSLPAGGRCRHRPAASLAHPRRGRVAPPVPIQMQPQRIAWRLADVAPADHRRARQRARRRDRAGRRCRSWRFAAISAPGSGASSWRGCGGGRGPLCSVAGKGRTGGRSAIAQASNELTIATTMARTRDAERSWPVRRLRCSRCSHGSARASYTVVGSVTLPCLRRVVADGAAPCGSSRRSQT